MPRRVSSSSPCSPGGARRSDPAECPVTVFQKSAGLWPRPRRASRFGGTIPSFLAPNSRLNSVPTAAVHALVCPRLDAPVAQLDRAPDFESGGQGFESLPARHVLLYVGPRRRTIPKMNLVCLVFGSGLPFQSPRTKIWKTSGRCTSTRVVCTGREMVRRSLCSCARSQASKK